MLLYTHFSIEVDESKNIEIIDACLVFWNKFSYRKKNNMKAFLSLVAYTPANVSSNRKMFKKYHGNFELTKAAIIKLLKGLFGLIQD